jgi:aminopeptidase N
MRASRVLAVLALALPLAALAAPQAAANSVYGPSLRPYDVSHYRIGLRLLQNGHYHASTLVTLTARRALRSVELDAQGFTIDQVTLLSRGPTPGSLQGALPQLAGTALRFEHLQAVPPPPKKGKKAEAPSGPAVRLVVHLPSELPAGAPLALLVRHRGQTGTEQMGFFRADTPGRPDRLPLYITMFEPEGARRFFPCHDHPSDKATTEVVLEVDPRYQAYANGSLVSDRIVQLGVNEAGAAAGRYRQAHWLQERPHSTYLVAIAIGQFETLKTQWGKTPIAIHVTPGNGARSAFALEATRFSMEFLERFLRTPYPWARYDQAALPTFIWGGMENTTLTVQSEPRLVLDAPASLTTRPTIVGLVAHELAHQWFGDLVTMVGWEDVWLNEAFASYMESQASAAFFKNDGPLIASVYDLWDSYFRTEQGPKSHPIVQTELPTVDDAFDSISYTKGEHVLRMLRHHLGDLAFLRGLHAYLGRYAHSNATNLGLFTELERASGKDLSRFRQSWVLTRGYPVITARWKWDARQGEVQLDVAQRSNHAKDRTQFVLPMEIVVHRKSAPAYSKTVKLLVDGTQATQRLALPAAPEWVNWNHRAIVLGEIVTPGRTRAEVELQARHDPDTLARLRAQLDLIEPMVRREKPVLPAAPVVELLGRVLCEDSSPYVRAALLSKLVTTRLPRLPPALAQAVVGNAAVGESQGRACSAALPMDDTVGLARLRSAGLEAAGLAGTPEARALVARHLTSGESSTDVLGPAARGMARFADGQALDALRVAHSKHVARGYVFEYALAGSWSRMPSPLVTTELRTRVTAAGTNEAMVRQVIGGLYDNGQLMRTPEAIGLVVQWVVTEGTMGEEIRSRILGLLDEVKTPAARSALRDIIARVKSDRLRQLAKLTLKRNFR